LKRFFQLLVWVLAAEVLIASAAAATSVFTPVYTATHPPVYTVTHKAN
jgi:hypothetical protein